MPIEGRGWELHIRRTKVQMRGTKTRTVGEYQVFHDGEPAGAITIGDRLVPLSGTTAESPGPSQNSTPATAARPSRILAQRYPLATSGGPTYVTTGYRDDLQIEAQMPGIELLETGARTAILIHPGKNEFLSSIGCINLCTTLPDGNENIDYAGSRRRVIALIEDMKRFLDAVPSQGDRPIRDASVTIDGDPMPIAPVAAAASDSVDGNALAAEHNVGVKSAGVKIAKLHPAMAKVIAAVADAARVLDLPRPVITSGNDSNHKQGSLHFRNRALDFRGNNISLGQGEAFEAAVAARVGSDYDVIFETFPNKSNNHLHVEFDPD